MSHLKLQKLLFYTQAWHLALYHESLFDEDFQAWACGPMLPSVYRQYAKTKCPALSAPDEDISSAIVIDRRLSQLLSDIDNSYGRLQASQLQEMIEDESPWSDAREQKTNRDDASAIITKESMEKYYQGRYHKAVESGELN